MRTWLITGISRGLGKALAQAVLARGDTVVGIVREDAPNLGEHGDRLTTVKLDLTDRSAAEHAVRTPLP